MKIIKRSKLSNLFLAGVAGLTLSAFAPAAFAQGAGAAGGAGTAAGAPGGATMVGGGMGGGSSETNPSAVGGSAMANPGNPSVPSNTAMGTSPNGGGGVANDPAS